MNRFFFQKLAISNLKKNRQTVVPYLFTSMITAAVYYIMLSLSQNPGLNDMVGAVVLQEILGLGCGVVLIFSVIFLFYTNRFLMKRRKKEFGLYNILGMEKRHLAITLSWETIILYVLSMIGGLIIGIALDKILFLLLGNLINAPVSLGFFISTKVIRSVLMLFLVIFILTYINSVRQIQTANPIELLHSDSMGEREPKSRFLLAFFGILSLGSGYFLAITTKNPVSSLTLFFLAVILVIIGTYLLFTAGSVVFLKMLRRNKHYYYQVQHFTSVSGMLYRMKQNAVGLANICILSTMVLVMISSTSSLMFGVKEMIDTRYPHDFSVILPADSPEQNSKFASEIRSLAEKNGIPANEDTAYSYLSFTALHEENRFQVKRPEDLNTLSSINQLSVLMILPLDDYNACMGTNETLTDGEILLHGSRGSDVSASEIQVCDRNYTVKKTISEAPKNGTVASNVATAYMIVTADSDELIHLYEQQRAVYGDRASRISFYYGFDTTADKETQNAFYPVLKKFCSDFESSCTVEARANGESGAYALYGGMFFLGAFLGTLFLMAAILIIYYKQISEGFEDRERFAIMQKVGMSQDEIKSSIRSQVLMVFFLPLLTAGIHTAAAFPMVKKLLSLFNLTNIKLFLLATLICYLVFAVIYLGVYLLTSRTYYRIVSRQSR